MGGLDPLPPLLSRLGKHKPGKGACLCLGRLADVDVTVLRELIPQAFGRSRRLAAGWSAAPGPA
jgi:hypothetical protein